MSGDRAATNTTVRKHRNGKWKKCRGIGREGESDGQEEKERDGKNGWKEE